MTPASRRRTLGAPAAIVGRTLFTERPVRCTLRPAGAGAGISFVRTDLPGSPRIAAGVVSLTSHPVHPAFARIPPRHTALAALDAPDAVVYTTEHILGALSGLAVTDAIVELDAPELPIGDGSAAHFVHAILGAGTRDLGPAARPIVVAETITVQSPDGGAVTAEALRPGEHPSWRYELDYGPGAPLGPQRAEWDGSASSFARDIAHARTFSLQREASQMQALGLFRSFTPRDLLVVDDQGRPIDNAWRFENEPARHKLLDLVGDLALVGRPIHARISASRSGHALNHAMARALVEASGGDLAGAFRDA